MDIKELMEHDLYALLRVHPQANGEEIKKAYEKLYNTDEVDKELLEAAYKILSNEKKRKEYDNILFDKIKIMDDNREQDNKEKPSFFNFFENSRNILFSKESSILSKIIFIIAIIYTISPIDFLPDFFIPGIGYLDDVFILLISYYYGINSIKNKRR